MVTVPMALWYLAVVTVSLVPVLPLLSHLLNKATSKVVRNIVTPIRRLLDILIGLHCFVLIGSLLASVPFAFGSLVDAVKGIDIVNRLIVTGVLVIGAIMSIAAFISQALTYAEGGIGWVKDIRFWRRPSVSTQGSKRADAANEEAPTRYIPGMETNYGSDNGGDGGTD